MGAPASRGVGGPSVGQGDEDNGEEDAHEVRDCYVTCAADKVNSHW